MDTAALRVRRKGRFAFHAGSREKLERIKRDVLHAEFRSEAKHPVGAKIFAIRHLVELSMFPRLHLRWFYDHRFRCVI
jgi:hypothetical protein